MCGASSVVTELTEVRDDFGPELTEDEPEDWYRQCHGGFDFPPVMWWRILAPGAIALLLAPVVHLGFTILANLLHYPVRENPREPRGLHRGI